MADNKSKSEEKWEDKVNSSKLEVIDLDSDEQNAKQPVFDAQAYQSIKNIVARKIIQVDEAKEKVKEFSQSLKNILVNDARLAEAEEEAKKVKVIVSKRKQELMDTPEARSIKTQLRERKEELKDLEDSLSNQLLQLYQITGVKEFETASGEVREFAIKAKVKAGKK